MDRFLQAAMEEARVGMREGGVPIGSVLVLDGEIVGRGHNRQNQLRSIIRHAEIDCIDNASGLSNSDFPRRDPSLRSGCRTIIVALTRQ